MSQRMDSQRVQIKIDQYAAMLREVLGNVAGRDDSLEGRHAAGILEQKLTGVRFESGEPSPGDFGL